MFRRGVQMMSKLHRIGLFKLMLLYAISILWGCQPGAEQSPSGPPIKLSLAVSPAPYSALVAIADQKGFFKQEGLDVSLASYPSGREALDAVCRGDAQVATVADIAFSAKALEDHSIRILASIGTTVGSQIVARKDRNIQKPSDLKGKKIGFSTGTVSDYFLYSFLITENIAPKDVTEINIPPVKQAEAIVNGEVDAVSAFEIFAFTAKQRLGENAVCWDAQNSLAYHWLLATTENQIRSPEALKRLLRAMIKAEDFVLANQEETKDLIAGEWGFDPLFLRESWPRTRIGVSLDQSIVTSLQNYSTWQLQKEGKTLDQVDVLDYLHTGILNEVAPARVTIFR